MSLETDLRTWLIGRAALTALVGAGTAARVRLGQAQQHEPRPYLVARRISAPRGFGLAGPAGHGEATIQIDAWADDWLAAEGLAATVRQELYALCLTLPAAVGGTMVYSLWLANDSDDLDAAPLGGRERGPVARSHEWVFLYGE